MVKLRLVCLLSKDKKDGSGRWYRATFKKHTDNGQPTTTDMYLPEKVGKSAIEAGLIEDVDVMVDLDFDDYFRPTISSMSKASSKPTPVQASLGV